MSIALVVGNMIGSGIFLLPASLAPYGLNSIVAWLLSAAGAIALAVVLSRLSRAFPDGGGPYAYTHAAFGPLAAFLVAWGYWINVWVGNAAIATGAVSYLVPFAPRIGADPHVSAAVVVVDSVDAHGGELHRRARRRLGPGRDHRAEGPAAAGDRRRGCLRGESWTAWRPTRRCRSPSAR